MFSVDDPVHASSPQQGLQLIGIMLERPVYTINMTEYCMSSVCPETSGSIQFSSVQFAKINVVLSAKHFRTTTQ